MTAPTGMLGAGRLNPAVHRAESHGSAAFASLPFVHRAAISVRHDSEQQSAPMSHMRDQNSGREANLGGETSLNGPK